MFDNEDLLMDIEKQPFHLPLFVENQATNRCYMESSIIALSTMIGPTNINNYICRDIINPIFTTTNNISSVITHKCFNDIANDVVKFIKSHKCFDSLNDKQIKDIQENNINTDVINIAAKKDINSSSLNRNNDLGYITEDYPINDMLYDLFKINSDDNIKSIQFIIPMFKYILKNIIDLRIYFGDIDSNIKCSTKYIALFDTNVRTSKNIHQINGYTDYAYVINLNGTHYITLVNVNKMFNSNNKNKTLCIKYNSASHNHTQFNFVYLEDIVDESNCDTLNTRINEMMNKIKNNNWDNEIKNRINRCKISIIKNGRSIIKKIYEIDKNNENYQQLERVILILNNVCNNVKSIENIKEDKDYDNNILNMLKNVTDKEFEDYIKDLINENLKNNISNKLENYDSIINYLNYYITLSKNYNYYKNFKLTITYDKKQSNNFDYLYDLYNNLTGIHNNYGIYKPYTIEYVLYHKNIYDRYDLTLKKFIGNVNKTGLVK